MSTSNTALTRVLATLFLLYSSVFANAPFDIHSNSLNSGNATVAVNVPKTGTGDDLYFHFSAPSSYQWAAFGFGESMSSALVFMVYAASSNNLTLSPRISTGHSLPQYTDSVKVQILNGTSITSDGSYVVNAYCTGCRSWSNGKVDITSTSQPMIYAVGPQKSGFTSADVKATGLGQHDDGNNGDFQLDLQKATGDAGVPVITSNSTAGNTVSNNDPEDGPPIDKSEIPIAVHAFFVIVVFLFILPGGYLFLRVFDKVMIHAGIQTVGVIGLLAGIAAGIAYNVKESRGFSYHQALGIITTLLVLAAFSLGFVGHRAFKARGTPSPLMRYHRIIGPSAIVFGWITTITGFVYRGESRRIIPYIVVLLAVIIFVGGISFIMKKRKMRKAALVTPAAQNFNAGYYGQPGGMPPPPQYGQAAGYYAPQQHHEAGVPMQTFNQGPYDPHKAPGATVYETPQGHSERVHP